MAIKDGNFELKDLYKHCKSLHWLLDDAQHYECYNNLQFC